MDIDGTTMVAIIVVASTIGWMFTSWIRAKHGYPVENEWGGMTQKGDPDAARTVALLTSENEKLHGQIDRLEERIAVLERIATDKPTRLSAEIDSLK
jgi:hypothetical protein